MNRILQISSDTVCQRDWWILA